MSEREFLQSIKLSPNYATAHHWYAFYLANIGRLPEAIKELQRALEIDPLSLIIRGALAEALSEAGRNDEALAEVRKILEMDAGFARGHLTLAAVYEQKGMFKEAIAEIRKAQELGLPSIVRHVFLDDDESLDAVRRKLAEAEAMARRQGFVVVIGHPHEATLQALGEWLPGVQGKGLALAPATAVLRKRNGWD